MEERRHEERRSSDRTVHEIKEDIGELKGRMRSVEKTMTGVDESLKVLIKENAIIAENHRNIIQHDKRLTALENWRYECKGPLEALEAHLESDTPVGTILGGIALKGWYVVLGIVGMYLLDRLPRIIALLK